MVDNIELIKPLLKFESEDDYYFLQVLARKKDRDKGDPHLGSNNSSRLIKGYYINSIEYLDSHYEEIKILCRLFKARAMICLNKRSYFSSSHQMMVQLATSIQANNYKNAKMWNNVSGKHHPITDKTWLIDVDETYVSPIMLADINHKCDPEGELKIIEVLPSKFGWHIITKPFNKKQFRDLGYTEEIHTNNPTNLFII